MMTYIDPTILLKQALETLKQTASMQEAVLLRQQVMGKTGTFSAAMRGLKALPPEERQQQGAFLNQEKEKFLKAWEAQRAFLQQKEITDACQKEALDLSCDSHSVQALGHPHVLSTSAHRIVSFFRKSGFTLHEGPEIEDPALNFDALNIPPHHPARASHDTFYIKETSFLLRTHTSPVQVRTALQHGAPLRIISMGRVFRDDSDATHTPMFHQIEGLVIEPGLHMGHLKGCLKNFLETFFERKLEMRFRPNYFPFTEPSAEVDIKSTNGKWLEVLGCGMVHPNVLRNMGIDPRKKQGFAFGMGIERLTMLKEKIDDLRLFFASDKRFAKAYHHTFGSTLSA